MKITIPFNPLVGSAVYRDLARLLFQWCLKLSWRAFCLVRRLARANHRAFFLCRYGYDPETDTDLPEYQERIEAQDPWAVYYENKAKFQEAVRRHGLALRRYYAANRRKLARLKADRARELARERRRQIKRLQMLRPERNPNDYSLIARALERKYYPPQPTMHEATIAALIVQ